MRMAMKGASQHSAPAANEAALISAEIPLRDSIHVLSVVAAKLTEAACRARNGDREGTRVHLARAVALFHGKRGVSLDAPYLLSQPETPVARGALAAWRTRKVFAYVEANLSQRIRIQELAQVLGLSASHFCRAFTLAVGSSPRQYVLSRRIERAQRLMLTTAEPISSIAIKCGMCDQAHLTRTFRRRVGETPHTWRRARAASCELTSDET